MNWPVTFLERTPPVASEYGSSTRSPSNNKLQMAEINRKNAAGQTVLPVKIINNSSDNKPERAGMFF
jgi:hypothetical protein